MSKTKTVFYSWQSDLEREKTSSAIRNAIGKALIKLDEDDAIKLNLDEAARGKPGSPEIPSVILKKISEAEVFVCDITTINEDYTEKKTPNPNVLIELGYAVAHLGWDRIIMLYHKDFGVFPDDIPFDLDKRRVTTFVIKNKKDNNGKANLSSSLYMGLKNIIEKNPPKPYEKSFDLRRTKDIQTLQKVFSSFDVNGITRLIQILPNKIHGDVLFYWEGISQIFNSETFYIYDNGLREQTNQFKKILTKIMNNDDGFKISNNYIDIIYDIPGDIFPSEKSRKDFYTLRKDVPKLRREFRKLIHFVKENYIEVDIDMLSKVARKEYLASLKD